MSIENHILKYITIHEEASANELQEQIGVSRQMIHRVLHGMLVQGYLQKLGRPPKVFYKLKKTAHNKTSAISLSEQEINFLNQHFLIITETGQRLDGVEAMQ